MNCSLCHAENRQGARFCRECGGALFAAVCPSCGANVEVGSKFCDRCGTLMAATTAAPPDSARAIVDDATGPVHAAKAPAEAERRKLTVMFSDLVGSTELAARLDPEVLRDVVRSYQQVCDAVIGEFHGTVAQYLGDGLLVYFGYPVAREHDPRRAVRAGVGIIDALAHMVNAQLEVVYQGHDARTAELTGEIERLEGQASHLVRFLTTGGDLPAVRDELRTIETTLEGLRAEWATIEKASALPPPRVHPAWVMTKLERLDAWLRREPQRAKVEILKHLDRDLVIVPRPSSTGERRAEISRSRKKRQPPEGSGGCLPTGGCGGWI